MNEPEKRTSTRFELNEARMARLREKYANEPTPTGNEGFESMTTTRPYCSKCGDGLRERIARQIFFDSLIDTQIC